MSSSPPQPRLCQLKKWDNFDGYGFNLHGDKNKPGQHIGKIDVRSPAEAAGIKTGDKIIEVNGENVNNENHKQVVQRIKTYSNVTSLLVVDSQCDKYHKNKGIAVKSSLPYVLQLSSEDERIDNLEEDKDSIDSRKQTVTFEEKLDMFEKKQDVVSQDTSICEEDSSKGTAVKSSLPYVLHFSSEDERIDNLEEDKDSIDSRKQTVTFEEKLDMFENKQDVVSQEASISEEDSSNTSQASHTSQKEEISGNNTEESSHVGDLKDDSVKEGHETDKQLGEKDELENKSDNLNLNMTAKQMKELIVQRKKWDPRTTEKTDFWKKYQIVQTL